MRASRPGPRVEAMARVIDPADRRSTIYDVAREAGVSPSTVSRTFSRPGRVSSRTAQRVRSVAEVLGYRADEIYRPATQAPTAVIGLAISDVTDPFYFPIVKGAERTAAAAGYSVLLADAQESERVEREMLRRIVPNIDGLVIASSRISDTNLRALAKIVPIVVLNRSVVGLPCVVPDNPRGIRRAMEHLGSLGHDRITYVAGPDTSWANGTRWRAATEAAEELRLSVNRLGPFEPTVEGGLRAAETLRERRARCVLAYNDLMAMGVMRGLAAAGIDVPSSVSVVGADNIFAADLVTPGLTTVAAPLATLGETAVRHVLALAGGSAGRRCDPVVVPMRLLVRQSTAPPSR